jgi:hypothetical protein
LKGQKVVSELTYHDNTDKYLEVTFTDESKLKIYCQKKQYRRRYDKWFIPDYSKSIYHLYSVISDNANVDIKNACDFSIDLPSLLPEFVDIKYQETSCTHAYLDIAIARLERIKNGRKP